ncbi:LHCB4 [Auxenochlorella protothecoides x Auxenochlorella symbiontica]
MKVTAGLFDGLKSKSPAKEVRKGNVKLPPPRTPKVDFPTKLSKPKAPVAPPKKSPLPEVTKFARASVPQTNRDLDRKGGRSSYNLGRGNTRKQGETLWLPNTPRPEWLDGSLPGDRGFDPLGLSKPTSYIQMDLDALDQNSAVNKAGGVVGSFASNADEVSPDALAPYSEVFGLARFRENEVIHGRWAMLATLGVIVAEASTGVAWQDAGKVELDGAQYLGFPLPFTLTQLVWIEALLVGGAEVYRNTELDTEKRAYPGGWFDPLRLASGDDNRAFKLKEAELKHGRLAMIAFLGFSVQAWTTGEGALGSLAKFATSFAG